MREMPMNSFQHRDAVGILVRTPGIVATKPAGRPAPSLAVRGVAETMAALVSRCSISPSSPACSASLAAKRVSPPHLPGGLSRLGCHWLRGSFMIPIGDRPLWSSVAIVLIAGSM
jgi:hypothetical protein